MRVAVQNGEAVRAGQALVYLRDTQFQDQLRQAEAALRVSQAEARRTEAALNEVNARLERFRQLAEKQFLSAQEFETLQAQAASAEATHEQALARIAQAEATVEESREDLRRTVIRAPIDGRIGQRNAEIGMRVDPSSHLFTIGNFDLVRVEVAITDEMISRIDVGQTALITVEDGNYETRAQVSRISPFLEAGSYSAEAEIDVINTDGMLRPGMFVMVDVLYGESEQTTLLPTSVIYESPTTGRVGVFVAPLLRTETPIQEPDNYDEQDPPPMTNPTPMAFREVEVMGTGLGMVGLTGVQPGDWVVTVGQNLLGTRGQENLEARARPMTWERIATLQELQDQDLLRQFMEKQQRIAREAYNGDHASVDVAAETVGTVANTP